MSDETCARCGQPAKGYATIDGARYCHEGPDPTCYMSARSRGPWHESGRPLSDPTQAAATGDERPCHCRYDGPPCPRHPLPADSVECRHCGCPPTRGHVYGERKCCPDCDHRPLAPVAPGEAGVEVLARIIGPLIEADGNTRYYDLAGSGRVPGRKIAEAIIAAGYLSPAEVEARVSAAKAAERERIAVAIDAKIDTIGLGGPEMFAFRDAARIARDGGDQS